MSHYKNQINKIIFNGQTDRDNSSNNNDPQAFDDLLAQIAISNNIAHEMKLSIQNKDYTYFSNQHDLYIKHDNDTTNDTEIQQQKNRNNLQLNMGFFIDLCLEKISDSDLDTLINFYRTKKIINDPNILISLWTTNHKIKCEELFLLKKYDISELYYDSFIEIINPYKSQQSRLPINIGEEKTFKLNEKNDFLELQAKLGFHFTLQENLPTNLAVTKKNKI